MLEAGIVRLILGLLFLVCLLAVFYLRQRKAARLLMAIGSLHVLGGIWVGREPLARIFRERFFGEADSALGNIASRTEKELVFWFLLWGVFTFLLGQLISWIEKQGRRPPAYIGWELAGISLVAALLIPTGGFWLLLLPAFLIVRGARKAEV
jgi:hypothetical protein